MKYNKSEIMKKAWAFKKANDLMVKSGWEAWTFGECLKKAWKLAKEKVEEAEAKTAVNWRTFTVADWFVGREQMHAHRFNSTSVKKETKKAILIHDANGPIWVPKSIITYDC